jgi:hypothetical protein
VCGDRRLAAWVFVAIAVGVVAAGGCGRGRQAKPELFRLRGRIVDAETKQGMAQVRLVLSAVIPTAAGKTTLKNYGITAADGFYDIELSEGFETLRYASQIRLEAAKHGYAAVSVEVPAPMKGAPFFRLGDIVMARSGAGVPSGSVRPPVPRGAPRAGSSFR